MEDMKKSLIVCGFQGIWPGGSVGQSAALSRRRSRVRVPSGSLVSNDTKFNILWDHSSAGRAPALQAGGHRFEPCWSHYLFNRQNAAVAELADAQDLKSCGTYTPVPVRFRFAAVVKSVGNIEKSMFPIFFCLKFCMQMYAPFKQVFVLLYLQFL